MLPLEIAPNLFALNLRDWEIRDFHGYAIPQGTSYNAFLLLGEKNVLIDTVKEPFTDEFLDCIRTLIPLEKIDCVVSNHTEMDHTGALPRVMEAIGREKPIYCSKMGAKNLGLHFHENWNFKEITSGEELKIDDKRTLMFLETRMLHWPDSMFTYLKEEGILFSSDAFGQHYAGSQYFDDEMDSGEVFFHAAKYYANILLPYSHLIAKLLSSISAMGLTLKMICPDHGVFWRKDIAGIFSAYERWSRQEARNKAVVLYDTMWHSTEKMARAIGDGLMESGVAEVLLINARKSHRSDIITEILEARALLVGSPTLNNQIFPALMDSLTYIKGLKPAKKIAAAFGSYGWSGEAVKLLNAELAAMGFELPEEGLRVSYVPKAEHLELCRELGKRMGERIQEMGS
ncbi:flavodoxin domain-containing protein [Desulfococcaceae bacterium OttesenSCG-928-F15]|nr:flavodoxin domain-containing protein [Desulfococcaceae bacterium OttesenSCG-928-F15]